MKMAINVIPVMQAFRFRAQHSGIYLFDISAGGPLALLNLVFTLYSKKILCLDI